MITQLLKTLITALLWAFSLYARAQTPSIKLDLKAVKYNAKQRVLELSAVISTTDSAVVFYKPEEWNFCASLIYVGFEDCRSKVKGHYFPCKAVMDLDRVILTKESSVVLTPHQPYQLRIKLRLSRIYPALKSGHCYVVKLRIDHEYLGYGLPERAFKGHAEANVLRFTMP
ncbi:hypothetical protein [Hymenobacter edaphi]|uniref:hypothetical protein n=1 Tax=Hymenobacter edaphi TaxID=2211146 RepID=UPI0010581E0F|nr:hypothetical protein [Hymenobacter edaphi]